MIIQIRHIKEKILNPRTNVTTVPDIREQALAVKDFQFSSRMTPFLSSYLNRQKNATRSKFGLFLQVWPFMQWFCYLETLKISIRAEKDMPSVRIELTPAGLWGQRSATELKVFCYSERISLLNSWLMIHLENRLSFLLQILSKNLSEKELWPRV